eukprot:15458227-Alexandrium_andersonii.AAC.1
MDTEGPVDPEGEEAEVLRELEDASKAAVAHLRSSGPPSGPSGFPCFDAMLAHLLGSERQGAEQAAEQAA